MEKRSRNSGHHKCSAWFMADFSFVFENGNQAMTPAIMTEVMAAVPALFH
jgi:hypothetical protein